jgi:DUF2075 family protein
MMSGYSWKWVSRNEKNTPGAVIDDVSLTWNRVSSDWINSTTDATEMGCIHTVQGYDLNFAGVIFGEEIGFDKKTNLIVMRKENYHDAKGKATVDRATCKNIPKSAHHCQLNTKPTTLQTKITHYLT